jgi:large subunit ribosomal protein L11
MAAPKKKIAAIVKLQLPAGKANPAPPVGTALGPHGVNMMGFCKEFNDKTKHLGETVVPIVITIYADRSFTFIMKSAPTSLLVKKAAGLKTSKKPGAGSKEPNRNKVGVITMAQVEEVAKEKMQDLNAKDLKGAMNCVIGTARSMGIEVKG